MRRADECDLRERCARARYAKATGDAGGTDLTFRLQPVHARTRGERVGHTGSSIEPTTTEEHLRMQGPAIR